MDVLQLLSSEFQVRPLGLSQSYLARSCEQVGLVRPDSPSGIYWIADPEGLEPVQTYCQF